MSSVTDAGLQHPIMQIAGTLDEPGNNCSGQLSWKQVIAMFTDDYEAAEAVRAAREAVRGRTVSEALAAPEVVGLLEGHDLLWYAPEELDRLS